MQNNILVQASDSPGGLHCISADTGQQKWWFNPQGNMRGHTPAVDQDNGIIYFQTRHRLWKINALNGALIKFTAVNNPAGGGMGSGNTVLVNDAHGYFIATAYNDYVAYGGGVKVYDQELNLVWQDTNLMLNLKTVMAYHDGVLYVGIGNSFGYSEILAWYDGELENAGVRAYDITNGNLLWEYICDPTALHGTNAKGVIDVIYCNGYVLFTDGSATDTSVYVLNASTGTLLKKWTADDGSHSACAPAAFSGGRFYFGSLAADRVKVIQVGTGLYEDWNTYGHYPQMNHNVAHPNCLQTLDETPTLVGNIEGGNQGGIIIDGVGYFIKNHNVVKFNPDTLAIIDNFPIHQIYDSTPLFLENKLLVKENANARVIALNPETGDRVWNSDSNMFGNLFFGMNYFTSDISDVDSGITKEEFVNIVNTNANTIVAMFSLLVTVQEINVDMLWPEIITKTNETINAINVNGVAATYNNLVVGMEGTALITTLNNFWTSYVDLNS